MIVVLERETREAEIQAVLEELGRRGLEGRVLRSADKPLVHVVGGSTRAARPLLRLDRVQALVPTSGPRIRREGRHFYPYHFIGWSALCLALAAVLVLLAGFLPPGLGAPANPDLPPETLRSPWFLRPLQALFALFPPEQAWLGWLLLALVAGLLLALPYLDRTRGPGLLQRWPVLVGGLALAAAVILMTLRAVAP